MNSSLTNFIYGKPIPPAQFLVHYEDFLRQEMAEWCMTTVKNKTCVEIRKLLPDSGLIPVWFKRDIDALSFKLAFNDYVQEIAD